MDKEQAKFILESFRPDGADAHDDTFAEALQLAVEDRELGEWLAGERASDAEFASTLMDVEIPDQLRLHILAVMRGEEINDPDAELVMDEMLCGALEEVEPPTGLKDQILAAMAVQQQDREAGVIPMNTASEKKSGWLNMKGVMSMAAALALGGFLALQVGSLKSDGVMSAHVVQQHAGDFLNASFELDVKNSNREEVKNWLVSNNLPSPSSLPSRLAGMKILGCKKVMLPEGQEGSLLCYSEGSGGDVHVVIVKNEMIKGGRIPFIKEVTKKNCYFCSNTGMDVASWQDDKHTYIMMAQPQQNEKNTLIRYF